MKPLLSFGRWLLALFNPPPRDSLSFVQKIGRVLLVTLTLVTFSIVSALAVAVALFIFERLAAGQASSLVLLKIIAVLLDSLIVNAVCLFILLQVKRLDETLIPREPTDVEPKA